MNALPHAMPHLPPDSLQPPAPTSATPRWYGWAMALSILAALVPTLWPQLDLMAAATLGGPEPLFQSVGWWWVELINAQVPTVFRAALVLALLGWMVASWKPTWRAWRLPLAFVVLAGIAGPGAVVNLGFKDNWQRARPYQVDHFGGDKRFSRATVMTDQCSANCSFVSGHVACGVFLISVGLVHRRRQRRWAAAGVVSGLTIGFARMADSAHWLSDVLWAFPITLLVSWLVWKTLQLIYNRPSRTVA